MKGLVTPVLIAVIALIAAAVLGQLTKKRGSTEQPRARAVMTPRELEAFATLTNALTPRYSVLAQVSFAALLTAKNRAIRNTFDRKMADFVALTHDGTVAAIIEIDDRSHNGREASDGKRDDMLTNAGYRVIRYRKLPSREQVEKDIANRPAPLTSE